MIAAVALGAKIPAEGSAEPAVREAPETAFGEVVARAVAKGGPESRARAARDTRAGETAEPDDAALYAYVAALVSQAPAMPFPSQAEEAVGVQGSATQDGAAFLLPSSMSAVQGMPQTQSLPEARGAQDALAATYAGAQAPTPLHGSEKTASAAPHAEQPAAGQPTLPHPPRAEQPAAVQTSAAAEPQPSFAGQMALANPRIRQKSQASEALNASMPQRSGDQAASDTVSASPKSDGSALGPAYGAGQGATGGGAESGAANRSTSDRYAQVQAQAEKVAASGKGRPSNRDSGEEGAPRPVEERQALPGSVLPEHRAEPVLGLDKSAEAQRPEAASSPREADAAAQLFRATTAALSRGETRYSLKLRPEGLGEVAVAISARDRELHLAIRTQSESTREIILNQIGALKLELASSDYRLSGFSVDVSGGGAGGEASSAFHGGQERRNAGGGQPEARPTPVADAPRRGPAPEMRAGAINLRA